MAAIARGLVVVLVVGVVALIAAIVLGFVDVSQTRSGALPKISVEGGQAPAFAVKTPEVTVGSTEKTVAVPKIDVGTSSRTVEVPSLEVRKPK